VLLLGEASAVDAAGRLGGSLLPEGKAGGVRIGAGTLAALPGLEPARGKPAVVDPAALDKALTALLGKGRRAVGVTGRARLLTALWREGEAVDVHLATLGPERAQGNTLFLGSQLVGANRKARFQSTEAADVQIRLNPSGASVSTILPAFSGYAVLSI
jgi:hypothetical protein